ncbi:MAG: ESX secretion-associated protein EspG [Actinomycetia bacterium]|nr:ESX secretion-associated protein EspG [Actinomycetes bacterium]
MGLADAVELTVEQAWFIADSVGAGTFPWVLAITPPYSDAAHRAEFETTQFDSLTRSGVIDPNGRIDPSVADWIQIVCYCNRWLELRFIGSTPSQLMRGIVARRQDHEGDRTVVALRDGDLVTVTSMTVDHPGALVPIVQCGLPCRHPADFPEFAIPARAGARADDRLRAGADLAGTLDFLGVPPDARSAVEAVFTGPRRYVEIVAGQRHDGVHTASEVGVSVVDTTAGRILVSPAQASDGQWISTFAPAETWAIAVAVDRLTAALPGGPWFPAARLTRDFAESS